MRLLSSSETKNKKRNEQEKFLMQSIHVTEIMNQKIKKLQILQEQLKKDQEKYFTKINKHIIELEDKKLMLQLEINILEKKKNILL